MTSSGIAPPRVAVVGGGLAGIAATIALSDAGIGVDLFEANQRLGGRVGSFDDPATGETVDYCQHVGMACCTNLVYLINRLGINHEFKREKILHFFSADGRHLPIKAWPLPAPLHLSGMLLGWPDLTLVDRASVAKAMLALMRLKDNDPALDRLAIEWLRPRQSERAIDTFWKTILVSALGERIERVALRPAAKVLLDGFTNNRTAYHLLVPQRPLRELFDEHCKRVFEKNSLIRLHLGCRVSQIHSQESEKQFKVSLVDQSGTQRNYDQVISCIPWYRVNDVLEMDTSEVNVLQSSPITGIHTWWDRKWLNIDHAILVNRQCQWLFSRQTNGDESSNGWYCQVVISGTHDVKWKSNSDVEMGMLDDVGNIFPQIKQSKLLKSKVVTDPRAVFSVQPETQTARWPSTKHASEGVWLAGDWTDTLWPATMEGAVRSGFQAAQQVGKTCSLNTNYSIDDLPVGAIIKMLRAL